MSKTNFSKVEGAFDDGLNRIKMKSIYDKADEVISADSSLILEKKKQLHQILIWMRYEVKTLQKKEKQFLQKAELDASLLGVLDKAEEKLEEPEWRLIIDGYKKLVPYVKASKEKQPSSDQDLLTSQQKRNEKKRFNVSERWIPLK